MPCSAWSKKKLNAPLGNTVFTAAPLPSVGFATSGAKTCHLQLQVKVFVDILHVLPLSNSCACACCLLWSTGKDIVRGEKTVCVEQRRQCFAANGLDFDAYQAGGDVVEKIHHCAQHSSHGRFALESPLEMFAIQVREESQRICSESCLSVQPLHEHL